MASAVGRSCSRVGCRVAATMTLTYNYSESLATLSPISPFAEPHTYDLCEKHAAKLTVPHGWKFQREVISQESVGPTDDDLMAIADAVREAANLTQPNSAPINEATSPLGRRGHLRAVPN